VSRPGHICHDLGSAEGDVVEKAQRGVVDDAGGRGQFAVGEVEEEGADLVGAQLVGGASEVACEGGDVAEVVGGGACSEVAQSEIFRHLLPKRSHGVCPSGPPDERRRVLRRGCMAPALVVESERA